MVKSSRVDPCMLCGSLPCSCMGGKAKGRTRPRKVQTPIPGEKKSEPSEPPPASKPSMADRMRARAAATEVAVEAPADTRAKPKSGIAGLPQDLADSLPAIQLLVSELDAEPLPGESAWWEPYVEITVRGRRVKQRAAEWRSRRMSSG